ncbi:MAG: conjugal transfer protein TraG, partial [Phyllobacterium sp.]|nr:conjugal transfer protein TraG [Phyllobacterium sp.]
MAANRIVLSVIPTTLMVAAVVAIPGIEQWLAGFGKTAQAKLLLGRIGLALPYAIAAGIGVMALFAANGSARIKTAGWSVASGSLAVILVAVLRETMRLTALAESVPTGKSVFAYVDPSTGIGTAAAILSGIFAMRVALNGNAAF